MRRARAFDRLSAADVSNFVFEHPGQSYAVAMVGVVDLGTSESRPTLTDLRRLLADRAATIPELNQRVHFTRWGEGRPVWLRQPADLAHHVRVLEPVAGRHGLVELAARLVAERLPRDRPLWDVVVVPGVGPDQVGLVVRIHHAVADGLAALALVAGLFDHDPSGGPASPGAPEQPLLPEPPPRSVELRLARLAELAAMLRRARRRTRGGRSSRSVRESLLRWRDSVRRVLAMSRRSVPDTCLVGPLSEQRELHLVRVDLAAAKAAAHRSGATVTDAVLAAVAGGLRRLLSVRGEALHDVPVSVPVSLRAAPGAQHGNEVGVMLVDLPVTEPDVWRRLVRVSRATRTAKQQARAAGTFELTRVAWAMRLMDVMSRHQRVVASFVTSLPGPEAPLHLAGATVVAAWPASVIAGNIRLSVAVLSYAGQLHLTVISDARALPDAGVFADALSAELDALAGAVVRGDSPLPGPP
jgi:WS/DGAT/MGAT family acyltransferase